MRSVHELSRHHLATLPSIFLSSKRNLQAASFSHGCSKNLAYRAASKEWGAAGEEAEDAEATGDAGEEAHAVEAAESAEEEKGDAADGTAADAGEAADETAEVAEEEKGDAARDGAESRVGGAALGATAAGGAAEADPQSLRQFLPLTFSRRIPFLSASQKHALGKSTCSDFITRPMESRLSSMQTKQRHKFFLVLNDRLA